MTNVEKLPEPTPGEIDCRVADLTLAVAETIASVDCPACREGLLGFVRTRLPAFFMRDLARRREPDKRCIEHASPAPEAA